MKTIQKNETVKRVDNATADKMVRKDNWEYIPKKNKEHVRNY
jgi:hypothetical protein